MGRIIDEAMTYFNRIPDGARNAIARPANMNVDRSLRKMIERANNNGDCIVNTGDGHGYFRPVPGNKEDELALKKYLAKELHRARAIQLKRLSMKQTFESWKMMKG